MECRVWSAERVWSRALRSRASLLMDDEFGLVEAAIKFYQVFW